MFLGIVDGVHFSRPEVLDRLDTSNRRRFRWGQVFLPFDDFAARALPVDLTTYLEYRRLIIDFMHARNQRIAKWAAEHLHTHTSTTPGALGEPS